jgi:hypothetical protein
MDPVTAAKVSFIQPEELTKYIDKEDICPETLVHYKEEFHYDPKVKYFYP